MATTTPNLGLQKPSTPADDGMWGPMMNANADKLDAVFGSGGGGGGGGSPFGAAMLAWFLTLPTTPPVTAGVLWNNGGMLSLS